MPERDENEEAERAVREVTGSAPVKGEDLLPPELARKLRQARLREVGVCEQCAQQEGKGRGDQPHDNLVALSSRVMTGTGMYGGGGRQTIYQCKTCGSQVVHSSDKLDFPDFWIVRPLGR